ncbi:LysR family transcriptional regulator [Jannaschia formosa]|uniref:LysR family transcriptional regulator n=1 Tax=Jannaschia formosa TaxID=2259592 RepID=UPI001FD80396|nr:LysR family transcriptional regulator [Jannaschia formosa]
MIRNRITLKQLEAFAQVVDTGSFRAAASVLGTTQPNISARIAALEALLDTRLLHRDAGSVRLTEAGAALLERARAVLRAAEALLEQADRRDLIEERLRLGVTELVACTWLRPYLRALRGLYPSLRIELEVDLSSQVLRGLAEGRLDLVLANGPFGPDAPGAVPLGACPYLWVATPALAAGLPQGDALDRLFTGHVLTHARDTEAVRSLAAEAERRGLPAARLAHSSALTAAAAMAQDGMGAALLPEALVRDDLARGTLVALPCDWHPAPLIFEARYDPARAPRFVSRAAELAAGIAKDKES